MKNSKIIQIGVLTCFVLMVGCASNSNNRPNDWYKTGMTPEQIKIDMANCRLMAEMNKPMPVFYAGGGGFLASAMISAAKEKTVFEDCMVAKGYIKTNELKTTVSKIKK